MKRTLNQAVELYESFREAKPRRLKKLTVTLPKIVACMGYLEMVHYRTTHKRKTTLYQHEFAPGSRPLLCVSADGRQIMLIGGRYQWTDRGIVDHDSKGQEIDNPAHGKAIENPTRRRKPKRKL